MSIPTLPIVLALAWSVLFTGCGGDSGETSTSGAALFAVQGCVTCHGASGDGTALGPAIAGAAARWQRAELIEYLKNPKEYAAKDARLAQQGARYTLAMPNYDMLTPAQLSALADFVLARP